MFADGAQHMAWISYRHYVSRNVLCHNASRTDHTAVTDRNAAAYGDISCDPAVVANSNWFGIFLIGRSTVLLYILISVLPTKWMFRSEKRNIRTDENILTTCNWTTINTCEIEIIKGQEIVFNKLCDTPTAIYDIPNNILGNCILVITFQNATYTGNINL